jgi:hypothetical protein
VVRLQDPQPVAQPEVGHPVRAQHPPGLGEHRVGVDDVLVDVVEHDDVDRGVAEGQLGPVGADEIDPVPETAGRPAQAGDVDVEAGHRRAGLAQGVADVAGRAADVDHAQAVEAVPAEEVAQHRYDLRRLPAAPGFVERPAFDLGVGKLGSPCLNAHGK